MFGYNVVSWRSARWNEGWEYVSYELHLERFLRTFLFRIRQVVQTHAQIQVQHFFQPVKPRGLCRLGGGSGSLTVFQIIYSFTVAAWAPS